MERLVPDRVIEIEKAHGVGTSVGAVPGADAAVINLGVQPLAGMVACVGRAGGLTGRGIALLTKDGPELEPRIGKFAFPITLHADPVDGPPARRLIFTRG